MISVISELLKSPIGYHGVLAKALGSVPAAVMLSQGIYWQKVANGKGEDWFWVTAEEWYNQTGVTEESQQTARRVMRDAGVWTEKRMGLPAKMYYQVNVESLVAVISRYLETGKPDSVDRRNKSPQLTRTSGGKFRKQVAVDRRNEENTLKNTSETKEENTFPDAVAPGRPQDYVEEVDVIEENPAPAGKASPGPREPKKNWAKEMATAFDQTNESKHRAAGLPYTAFNWRIKELENFRHLKNLRTLGIGPDFKLKYGRDPSDEEMSDAVNAILERAWEYFRHIQSDKGGAIHFTPESIYRSYNTLKTFKNGNNNGIKSTRNGAGAKPPQSAFGRGIGLDSSPTAKFGY